MSSMTAVTTRTQAAHLWAIQVDSLSRQLPLDMILNILSKMSPRCLATISSTCKCYIALSKVDFVWTSLFHEHFPHPLTNDIHSKEIYPLEAYKREFTVNQNLMKGAFTWHHLGTHSQGGPVSIDIVGDQYISICEFDEIRYGNIKSNAKAKEKQFETQGSTCRIVADDKILVGYNEGKIEVWSSVPESPELQLTLTGHTGRVLGILFENDRLYSYSADQTIKIWNVTSGGCVATLKDVDETLESLAVKDGIIVMGTFEGEIKIWNPKALNSIITLPSRNDGEKLLALAIGDGTVYVSYSDKTIKAWKIEEKSSSLFAKCSESVFSLSIAGDKLISENGMGTILVWDLATKECSPRIYTGDDERVSPLAFAEGKLIYGVGSGALVALDFNASDEEILKEIAHVFSGLKPTEADLLFVVDMKERFLRLPEKTKNRIYRELYNHLFPSENKGIYFDTLGGSSWEGESVTFEQRATAIYTYLSAPLENNTQRENFLLDLGIVTLEDFTKALSCSPNFLPQVGILSSQDLDALGVRYRPVAHLKLPSLIDILAALKGMGTGLHARVKDVFKNSMPQSEIPWGSFLKKIDALYAQIEAQEGLLALFQPESHPNLMTRVNALINEFNTLHQAHLKEKLRAYISQENLASIWQDFQARGIDSLTILEFSSDEQMTEAYLFRMGKQQ